MAPTRRHSKTPPAGSGRFGTPAASSGWSGSGGRNDALGDARDRAGPRRNRAANPEDPMNVQDPSLREALARGRTLPAEWYTDPERFEREQERIFAASWNYVGRVEQVANA